MQYLLASGSRLVNGDFPAEFDVFNYLQIDWFTGSSETPDYLLPNDYRDGMAIRVNEDGFLNWQVVSAKVYSIPETNGHAVYNINGYGTWDASLVFSERTLITTIEGNSCRFSDPTQLTWEFQPGEINAAGRYYFCVEIAVPGLDARVFAGAVLNGIGE